MSFPFNRDEGLIIVRVKVAGPLSTWNLHLALDTDATGTLISAELLEALGYDPAAANERTEVTTASGIESAPVSIVQNVEALGVSRVNLSVLCYDLPPEAGVDGVLGLDFFRGSILTIDFMAGALTLDA